MTDINETGAASAVVDDTFLEEGMTRFAWLEETAGVAGLPGEEDRQSQATTSIIVDLERRSSEGAVVDREGSQPGQRDLIVDSAREARVAVAGRPLAEADLEGPPDTPSGSVAWLSRLLSMDTLTAATAYNDVAQRNTQTFLHEIRTNGQLAGIRREFDQLRAILDRPNTPAEVTTYLAPALKGFERELQNLEQGTPAIWRTFGFAVNLLPAVYTTVVAIKEQDRLLGVTYAASALRGVTTLVGKTVSTLGNTGVMSDHFIDWVLPWFVPPLIHAPPAFVEKYVYLADETWFTVVTALGATLTYVSADFGGKLWKLWWDAHKGAGARLTADESKEEAERLITGLEQHVAEVDATRDRHRVSPAVSTAMVQFKTEMGGVAHGLRKTLGQAAASAGATRNVNAGERTMKTTLATVAVSVLILRTALSAREPLLIADLAGYTVFVALKMFQSALSPHTRVEDTSNTFGGLVATGIPTIIPSIAETATQGKALESNIGLIVTILGLAAINLSVGGYLGKFLAQALLLARDFITSHLAAAPATEPTATIEEIGPGDMELETVPQ